MEQLVEIQSNWADETKWPADPESTATNVQLTSHVRRQHAWIKGLVGAVKLLQQENASLRSEIDNLKKKSHTLASGPPPVNWSKIASGMAHRDETAVAMMATIATEMRKK